MKNTRSSPWWITTSAAGEMHWNRRAPTSGSGQLESECRADRRDQPKPRTVRRNAVRAEGDRLSDANVHGERARCTVIAMSERKRRTGHGGRRDWTDSDAQFIFTAPSRRAPSRSTGVDWKYPGPTRSYSSRQWWARAPTSLTSYRNKVTHSLNATNRPQRAPGAYPRITRKAVKLHYEVLDM